MSNQYWETVKVGPFPNKTVARLWVAFDTPVVWLAIGLAIGAAFDGLSLWGLAVVASAFVMGAISKLLYAPPRVESDD